MPQTPSHNDFTVDVEGVGKFRFARKSIRNDIAIQVEYAELTGGQPVDSVTAYVCDCLARLRVQTVTAPDDWEPESEAAYDDVNYSNITKVAEALREHEKSFRPVRAPSPEGREGEGGNAAPVVPASVQPPAD